MIESVFTTFFYYLVSIWRGFKSVLFSSFSTLPTLFGIGDLRKKVTEQYPDPVSSRTEDDLPPRTRGLLFNDIEKCTGCGECKKICPVDCIHIETLPTTELGRVSVTVFDINTGRCLFCGLCVDVCHPGSLTHTKKFEGATYNVSDLVMNFGRGKLYYGRSEQK